MIQTVTTNKKVTLGSCVVLGLGSLRPLSERKRELASVGKFAQKMCWNPQPLYYCHLSSNLSERKIKSLKSIGVLPVITALLLIITFPCGWNLLEQKDIYVDVNALKSEFFGLPSRRRQKSKDRFFPFFVHKYPLGRYEMLCILFPLEAL